jgi:hypothetical protein
MKHRLDQQLLLLASLLKLHHLQNKAIHTIGKFARCTPIRELHRALPVPYIYKHVRTLYRQQLEVIQSHENANVRDIGKREARPDL